MMCKLSKKRNEALKMLCCVVQINFLLKKKSKKLVYEFFTALVPKQGPSHNKNPNRRTKMPQPTFMRLKILLPFGVFTEKTGVSRIVAETREGSFGLLPHRLDCVAALTPGILVYENEAEGEVYVAVDEGALVKTGPDVFVSVRNAIGGKDLGLLRETVEREFLNLNDREQVVRSVMAKMESGFIRRLVEFHHE